MGFLAEFLVMLPAVTLAALVGPRDARRKPTIVRRSVRSRSAHFVGTGLRAWRKPTGMLAVALAVIDRLPLRNRRESAGCATADCGGVGRMQVRLTHRAEPSVRNSKTAYGNLPLAFFRIALSTIFFCSDL